jgi:DNA-binding Lrp family transcriptional regulator
LNSPLDFSGFDSRKIDKVEVSQLKEGVKNLITAYIIAKVEAGKDEEVLKDIKKISGVKQATPTYGVYDLHVEVSFSKMEELDKFIFDGIRKVPGIKETVTLVAFKGV